MKFFHLKERINKTTEIYSFEKQNPKNLIFQYTIPFYLEIESIIILSKKRKRKKKKRGRVDRSKIHRFTRKMIRWKMEWAVKFLSGSNDGQSIQIYFFDLFVRRNENSIINVAPLYIHIYIYTYTYPPVGNRRWKIHSWKIWTINRGPCIFNNLHSLCSAVKKSPAHVGFRINGKNGRDAGPRPN